MNKMAVNFDFLKQSSPELYQLGSNMEADFFKDIKESAQYGSDFLNLLVREIYEKEGLKFTPKSFMTKDIDNLYSKGIIDATTQQILERAKMIRDDIINNNDATFERVLDFHSVLVVFASGFFDKYEKSKNN